MARIGGLCLLVLLFIFIALAVTPRLAQAGQGEEAIVLVTGPASTKDVVLESARTTLKERGYVVHHPNRASAALALLGGSVEGVLDGKAPLQALRDQLGVDLVVAITVDDETRPDAITLAAIAVNARRVTRRTATATAETLEEATAALVDTIVPASAPANSASAPPPSEDAVHLRDGTVITGRVKRQEPGRFVEIVASDGHEEVFEWNTVERVVLAPRSGGTRMEASAGGFGLEIDGTLEEAEAKRRAWQKRGGSLVSYELKAIATGILMPEQDIPCVSPRGSIGVGRGQGGGGGGGAGVRIGYLFLSPPDPTTETDSWFAFRIGTGFDFNAFSFKQPVSMTSTSERFCDGDSDDAEYVSTSLLSFQVPFPVGIHIGLGGFGSGSNWRGLVLGLAYSPSITYSKPGEGEGTTSFNPAGFDISFDITSLEASIKDYAKEAHFRISFFILPPISDKTPLFGSLGLGAVWY